MGDLSFTIPVIPAKAGIQTGCVPSGEAGWIPAFAGMTRRGGGAQ